MPPKLKMFNSANLSPFMWESNTGNPRLPDISLPTYFESSNKSLQLIEINAETDNAKYTRFFLETFDKRSINTATMA